MARKHEGQLVRTRAGYSARITTPEGARRQIALGTDSKAVARVRLQRLLTEGPKAVTAAETFASAVARLAPTGNRAQRLRDYAIPAMGELPVTEIRKSHVRDALVAAIEAGKALNTVRHLRVDISRVLHALAEEEALPDATAAAVAIPKGAKVDGRKRLVLTDEEFTRFMAVAPPELGTMAVCARCLGGMRTSDLHAWRWEKIDLHNKWTVAPRPKTASETRLALPEAVIVPLLQWWVHERCPTTGPVFPCRRGKRAGEHRKGKVSFAQPLRDALWDAGITRPPGATAREQCALQSGGPGWLPVDFHSFRRQFCSALAAAGSTVQEAMALAGHRVAQTHMRYVQQTEILHVPAGALPQLASPVPIATPAAPGPSTFSAPPGRVELPTNGLGNRLSSGIIGFSGEPGGTAAAQNCPQPPGAAFSNAFWEGELLRALRGRADWLAARLL